MIDMEFFFVIALILQLLATCQSQQCGSEVTISPSQAVKLGSNATITCYQANLSGVSWVWYFRPPNSTSLRFVVMGPHYSIQPNARNVLLIINITADHFANYTCEKVYDNQNKCFSNASALTLFERASITITPKQNRKYTDGESLNFTVVITGNPFPTTIVLQKYNMETERFFTYPSTKYFIANLRTISFPKLSLEDSGRYRVCVENSPDRNSIQCDVFTIVVTGLELVPPPMEAIKSGSNLSVICRVVNLIGNFQMSWQTASGNDFTNNPSVQVTQLNATNLQLFAMRVSKAINYICVLRNTSGIIFLKHMSLYVTDVPSPPRDLEIKSIGSNGLVSVTWTPPETDNRSPITGHYVTFTNGRGNSKVTKIMSNMTNFEYTAGCGVFIVAVTSENDCGNSSVVDTIFDTREWCDSSGVESPNSDNSIAPAIGAGVAVIVLFIGLTLLAVFIFIFWYKKQKRKFPVMYNPENPKSLSDDKAKSQKTAVTSTPPPVIKRTSSIRQYRNMLEVPRDNVAVKDFLQDGTYFELRKALLIIPENGNKSHEVMVKIAKQSASSEEEHNIREEIKMMSNVGNHENIVGILRTSLSESPAYLITEYFAHGDLLGFLRASRGHYGMYTVSPGVGYKTHPCAVQGQDLLKMATQVAAGMNYLSEKKIIHRSLCARNVLVGTGLQVKVYNYGSKVDSKAIPYDYAKWMAPEMLFDGTADTMSDVWSFAVTFWEIVTIGGSPYPHTHPEQIRELLQTGHRLPKPDHCADTLYSTIMDQCWKMDPSMRPTFSVLYKQLDDMCKSMLSYLDSSLYNEEEYSQFEETNLMTAL